MLLARTSHLKPAEETHEVQMLGKEQVTQDVKGIKTISCSISQNIIKCLQFPQKSFKDSDMCSSTLQFLEIIIGRKNKK
jgi:hypothetical protein